MAERRPTNSELRLRRVTADERDPEPRGILELFDEPAEKSQDADSALTRADDDSDTE